MVKIWLKNMAGIHCTELELLMNRHPRRELLTHVTVKNVQTFSMLGLATVGPLMALYRGQAGDPKAVREAALTAGKYGACAGLVVGPVVVGARMMYLSDTEVYDRCYRLRHNHNVTRVDRMSLLGTLVGSGVAMYMGSNTGDGAILGMAGGILMAAVYNIAKAGTVIPDVSGM